MRLDVRGEHAELVWRVSLSASAPAYPQRRNLIDSRVARDLKQLARVRFAGIERSLAVASVADGNDLIQCFARKIKNVFWHLFQRVGSRGSCPPIE